MDQAVAANIKPQASLESTIEDQAANFPAYMQMLPSLFEFTFRDAQEIISKSVDSNADLLDLMKAASDYVAQSGIETTLKDEVLSLIEGEIEVITYSQRARCSVISL